MTTTLWEPTTVGKLELPHRVAMAPMTRDRSAADGTPTPLNAEYYAQRASTALIITEGTQPSEDGQGYLLTPGVHTPVHVTGWRRVTDAVHDAGGRIFIQLMHVGRICHPDNTPHHRQPVAPSAVAPAGEMFTADGMQPMPTPRELSTEEIAATVADFAAAARSAIDAGADGVEIHGANGYLVHQFLSSNANERTDRYGRSIENRVRFAVEVTDTAQLYSALVGQLAPLGLAYLHTAHGGDDDLLRTLRAAWPAALLVNRGGADIDVRAKDLAVDLADVVTVGSLVLANPDLVERLRTGAPLNTRTRPPSTAGTNAATPTTRPSSRAPSALTTWTPRRERPTASRARSRTTRRSASRRAPAGAPRSPERRPRVPPRPDDLRVTCLEP